MTSEEAVAVIWVEDEWIRVVAVAKGKVVKGKGFIRIQETSNFFFF